MGAEPCWRSRVTNPLLASDLIGHLARPGIDGRSRAGRKHDIHRIFAGRSRRDAAGDGKAQRTRGHRAHAVVRLVLYIMCVFSRASGEPASVLRASAPLPGQPAQGVVSWLQGSWRAVLYVLHLARLTPVPPYGRSHLSLAVEVLPLYVSVQTLWQHLSHSRVQAALTTRGLGLGRFSASLWICGDGLSYGARRQRRHLRAIVHKVQPLPR